MENTTLIIEEKEKEEAKALTQSFARKDVRSRAYVNALGSEICLKYLKDNNISDEKTYNMHNIRKILEEFDISDIILSNIHIDVRVVYNENEIFIPKTHFDYNLTPDVYVVLKISKNYSDTEFLGFFEPKMLNKNNANDKYYFIEKEKLSSPIDFKNFVENYQGKPAVEYSEKELEDAEFLMVSMTDHNVNETDKKRLLEYLKNSAKLRDKFIEFENFEMLAYQAINIADTDNITEEPSITEQQAEVPAENAEISEPDIFSDLNESDIVEEPLNEENSVLGGFVEGAAVLGAEIAGTAMASAALSGAAESVELAKSAADTTLSTLEIGQEILGQNEEKLEDISALQDNISSEAPILKTVEDNNPANDISEFTTEENGFDVENIAADTDFEELEFTNNDDYDDIGFENNDEYDDTSATLSSESSALHGSTGAPKIQPVMHTPITEATDLVSLDSIQSGNIKPEEKVSSSFAEIDAMDIADFQNLVDKYIPQDTNKTSETTETEATSEIGGQNPPEQEQSYGNIADLDEIPVVETEEHELELNDVELPQLDEIQPAEHSLMDVQDELSSDDFVQEMPEEINSTEPVTMEEEIPLSDIEDFKEDLAENNNGETEKIENIPEDEINIEDISALGLAEEQADLNIEDVSALGLPEEQTDFNIEDISDFGLSEKQDGIRAEEIPENTISDENIEITEDYSLNEIASSDDLSILDELDSFELPENENLNTTEIDNPVENINDITQIEQTENTFDNNVQNNDITFPEMNDEEIVKAVDMYEENKIEHNSTNQEEENNIPEFLSSEEPEIAEFEDNNDIEFIDNTQEEEQPHNDSLGLLYTNGDIPEIENSEVGQIQETTEFKPKRNNGIIMTVCAILASVIIAGALVGMFLRNRNSIDAETVIQPSPENELISPETDNSGVLLNDIEPAIPTDTADISPSAPAPETSTNEPANISEEKTPEPNQQVEKKQEPTPVINEPKKPLNANKTITLKKVSWEVPDYLSYSEEIRKYLQSAGRSIRLTLSSDLLLTNEYIYSNQVKVKIQLTKDGTIENAQIAKSSGSNQVDNIVLQTVKETLNVVKPAKGEVPTDKFKLGLIIYL